jgi:hypothetical protein
MIIREGGRRVEEYEQPCPGPLPGGLPDLDPDLDPGLDLEWAEYTAWVDRETAAGRDPGPGPWDLDDDEEPWDPAEAQEPWRPRFGQGDEADVLPPGPPLAGLTEEAVVGLARLSDDELVGVLQATRRQIAREQYKQVLVTAEFGRRRQAEFTGAARRGVPVGCRPGGFPGEELAVELAVTRAEAGHRIDDALDLTTRLPKTLAGMASGRIDLVRAGWIALYTRSLTPADAAVADEILAGLDPDLRADQVARRAAALEMRLAPEAVKARREHAKRTGQRVEARREVSGNASLSGREMDTAQVMASSAYINAMAAKLRSGGLSGPIGALRVLAMGDLTQGRNPLDRLGPDPVAPPAPDRTGPDAQPGGSAGGAEPQSSGPAGPEPDPDTWPGRDTDDADEADDAEGSYAGGPGDPARDRAARHSTAAPIPAQINLIIPVGTLLGWSTAPAQAGPWGLLDVNETRTIAGAAALHPLTRWCATLTGPDGTALAHACVRGQHPHLLSDLQPQPPPEQLAQLLRRLNLAFTPVARGTCDHAHAESRYTPSRNLRHLVRARTSTCDAPGCPAQALNTDLDHSTPWPVGPTDECNLAPRCRTHHRAKQAPDWQVGQLAPGVTRWTLPSGRTHTTTPTRYDT